jgi:hypothetical protein
MPTFARVRLHAEAVLVAIHDLAREDAHGAGEEGQQRLSGAALLRIELVALELELRLRAQRNARPIHHHELHVPLGAGAEHVAWRTFEKTWSGVRVPPRSTFDSPWMKCTRPTSCAAASGATKSQRMTKSSSELPSQHDAAVALAEAVQLDIRSCCKRSPRTAANKGSARAGSLRAPAPRRDYRARSGSARRAHRGRRRCAASIRGRPAS